MYMYIEIKGFLWLFVVQHSVIMSDFLMPETWQPIIHGVVIILIIYSPCLLKDLVEL